MFPNAEKLAKEALSLPMFPDLTKEEIEYIVSCVEDFFKKVKH
jgi:dTDP-4-amino-4,6-dideoxygalactose transaminase